MDFGKSSNPDNTVAPVVVSPDTDSNKASINSIFVASENISGRVPNRLRTNQKKTVTKNPSLVRSSPILFLFGSQQANPINRVIAKASMNIGAVFS